jgi:DNA topoisomerase I
MNLLLIESPGKLRKLGQILGPGWMVKASMGHVRELANDGEDALGFDLGEEHLTCRYEPRSPQAKKVLSELRQAVKQASKVYIATDPDREGETIGWHLQQALKLKNPERVVYSEITPQAVRAAIAHPRQLDQNLIAAGRARDCLDKLVGYKGSKHLVWQLNSGAKSMGRVQSAALHLLCLREREIRDFVPQDYWSIWSEYGEGVKAFYKASPQAASSKPKRALKQADQVSSSSPDLTGEDAALEDTTTREEKAQNSAESDRVTTQAEADRILAIARSQPHAVTQVEGKVTHQAPPPPLITSSLQQVAGARLKLSPERTMQIAQGLYEAGHITYMRTDSVALAEPFCQAVRQYLQAHDPDNLPEKATRHRASKSAQEAHEAIRPTQIEHLPGSLNLDPAAAKLYEIIWQRALASLCKPARLRKTRILTQAGHTYWEARGQVVEFAGYSRYWNNLNADTLLPALSVGQVLTLAQAEAEQKQTQPPPRYTEPKLVQLMEKRGIGRPSTYAPTIKTLKTRLYVAMEGGKGALVPTALGLHLDQALDLLVPDLIAPEFTAHMEAELDAIAQGQHDWERYLTDWHRSYFDPALVQAKGKLLQVPRFSASEAHGTAPADQGPASSLKASSLKASSLKTSSLKTSSPGRRGKKTAPADQAPASSKAPETGRRGKKGDRPCPKCQQPLHKVPSKSPKLKADHYLKCGACAAVMFWNPTKRQYESPAKERSPDPAAFTNHPCPSCGALLERYQYVRDGQTKTMLRCSIFEHRRQGKCQDVAYFATQEGFWSPKFGVLPP